MDNRRSTLQFTEEFIARKTLGDFEAFLEPSPHADTRQAAVVPAAELDRVEANAESLAQYVLALDDVSAEVREQADEIVRDFNSRNRSPSG